MIWLDVKGCGSSLKNPISWDVQPCRLVHIPRRFGCNSIFKVKQSQNAHHSFDVPSLHLPGVRQNAKDTNPLGFGTKRLRKLAPTFRRNMLPPSSRMKLLGWVKLYSDVINLDTGQRATWSTVFSASQDATKWYETRYNCQGIFVSLIACFTRTQIKFSKKKNLVATLKFQAPEGWHEAIFALTTHSY